MDGGSRNRNHTSHQQLLDLIHSNSSNREWTMKGNEGNFEVAEEKKLELRLGPPGGEHCWFNNENNMKVMDSERSTDQPHLSFGPYSSMVPKTTHNQNNTTTTWLMNKNENQNHKQLSSMEKQPVVGSVVPSWCSPPGFHMKPQQQFQQPKASSYLQFSSVPQSPTVVAKDSSQTFSTKVATELQNHTEKNKACFQTSATETASTAVANNSQKRVASAPVVGWPPIRSFRKNLASNSSSKPAPESGNGVSLMETVGKSDTCRKGLFVKINMDGIPIGRKVDLKAYDSYEKLSSAVDELFRSLLAAQTDSCADGNHSKTLELKAITGLLDGKGEYTLVYEDNEGDRILVGDVPWDMFVSTVKRLRVLKSSELSALRLGSNKQEKTPLESAVK